MNVAGIYQQPQFVVGVATWSQQGGYTSIKNFKIPLLLFGSFRKNF